MSRANVEIVMLLYGLPGMAKVYRGHDGIREFRGRGSGVALGFHYFQVTTVRNGRVTASSMGEARTKVLEALGRE